jgi:SAM-dependent methyltransferase
MITSIETYKVFADFYDLYVGKYDSDLDFYKLFCNKTDKIIEIGCGTGRILDYFLRLDYNIAGIDISQEMLDKASEKLKKWIDTGKLQLINHDFTIDGLTDRFDKALITFYTFNYILDKPIDFLSNVHKSLSDNGLLLIDLFYPNSLCDTSIDNKWINKEYSINGVQIQIRENRQMIDSIEHRQQIFCLHGKKIKIDTDRKYYKPRELKQCLEMAGYKNIEFSLDYDMTGFGSSIDENKLRNNYIVKAKK